MEINKTGRWDLEVIENGKKRYVSLFEYINYYYMHSPSFNLKVDEGELWNMSLSEIADDIILLIFKDQDQNKMLESAMKEIK